MPSDENDRTASRRRVLRAGAGTLATGAAAVGAGCSSLPPLGSQIKYGTIDVPAADPPRYREWLPAPSALPADNGLADGYSCAVHVTPPDDAGEWARTSHVRRFALANTDYVGVDVDEVEVAFQIGHADESGFVLLGDIDRSDVPETIERTTYEHGGTHAEYDVYERTDRERAVAIGPDAVAFGNGPDASKVATTIVDAGRGAVARYHDRDPDVAALTERAGQRRWGDLWLGGIARTTQGGILEETVGWAGWFDHEGEQVYAVETWVFPAGTELSSADVQTALKTHGGGPLLPGISLARAVDITVDGRVVTLEMDIQQSYARDELFDETYRFPQVTWRITEGADDETLTVHHDAGDPVRTDIVWIDGHGVNVSADPADAVGDRMEPGESFPVSIGEATKDDGDRSISIVLESPRTNRSHRVFEYDLP